MHKVHTFGEPSPRAENEGAYMQASRQGAPQSADGMKLRHFLLVALVISISVIYITYRSIYSYRTEPTLVKAFLCFRHGSRAPIQSYADDKYSTLNRTIWPDGEGQLTEKGKQEAFVLGMRLQERYGDFLGDAYNPAEVRVYCTPKKRTFASAELALAGLFPLHYQQDNGELSSRAILPQSDYIFNTSNRGAKCPAFVVAAIKAIGGMSSKMTIEENSTVSMALKHFENRSAPLGLDIFYKMWDTFYFQEREGLQLPEWTNDIYPEKMSSIAIKFALSYVIGSTLQKKILLYNYAVAVRNFLHSKDGSKMEIHSWHETNQLAIMNTFDISIGIIPKPTSCVVIEMHNRSGQMFFEVYYYESYKSREPRQMKMPCGYSCPMEELDNIINKYRLEDYSKVCPSGEPNDLTSLETGAYL